MSRLLSGKVRKTPRWVWRRGSERTRGKIRNEKARPPRHTLCSTSGVKMYAQIFYHRTERGKWQNRGRSIKKGRLGSEEIIIFNKGARRGGRALWTRSLSRTLNRDAKGRWGRRERIACDPDGKARVHPSAHPTTACSTKQLAVPQTQR